MRLDLLINLALLLELTHAVISISTESYTSLNLLQHVSWNPSIVPGDGDKTAYLLIGNDRNLEVSLSTFNLDQFITDKAEFTILAAVKQSPDSRTGSIISFTSTNEKQRYFEIESAAHRNEIRINYLHNGQIHTEIFPFALADNQWHNIALSYNKDFVQLFIDCRKIYERQTPSLDTNFIHQPIRLWLGQRTRRRAYFQGAIEYIKLVSSAQGYLEQCPFADVACPTCSQYKKLEQSVKDLYQVIETLNQKLSSAEARISTLEECQCSKKCDVNGTERRDGESWHLPKDHCTVCTCRAGEVTCEPQQCKPVSCRNPVFLDGSCCPICYRECFHDGTTYQHGEEAKEDNSCYYYACNDGSMEVVNKEANCPALACPVSEQVSREGECCKVCGDHDPCAECSENATCGSHGPTNMAACTCKKGFEGDGKHCVDIDECLVNGGHHGHYCHNNAICKNLPGSYTCECPFGFVKEGVFDCKDMDECELNLNDCSRHATCIDKDPGYTCECKQGYIGDGKACTPVCGTDGCLHGAKCVAPGVCRCRHGFYGELCGLDIDECKSGDATSCDNNAECINIPGSYYCKCKDGFHRVGNSHTCTDVNECLGFGGGHVCPDGTTCVNTHGGYTCQCADPYNCCNLGDKSYYNGQVFTPDYDKCQECQCSNGDVKCHPTPCDCSSNSVDYGCCHNCRIKHSPCEHQTLAKVMYDSGVTWQYRCQTCQCKNGETDCVPLECPRLTCPITTTSKGECCPRCADDHDRCDPKFIVNSTNKYYEKKCHFDHRIYIHGKAWKVKGDKCTSCLCKHGHICCKHKQRCRRKDRKKERKKGRRRKLSAKPRSDSVLNTQPFREERSYIEQQQHNNKVESLYKFMREYSHYLEHRGGTEAVSDSHRDVAHDQHLKHLYDLYTKHQKRQLSSDTYSDDVYSKPLSAIEKHNFLINLQNLLQEWNILQDSIDNRGVDSTVINPNPEVFIDENKRHRVSLEGGGGGEKYLKRTSISDKSQIDGESDNNLLRNRQYDVPDRHEAEVNEYEDADVIQSSSGRFHSMDKGGSGAGGVR